VPGLPDCEKFVMKLLEPGVHGADVLQIANWTLNGGPAGVPVKFQVRDKVFPA
jgi:hypothetical protein